MLLQALEPLLPSNPVTNKINILGNGSIGKVLIYFKPQAI